MPFAAGSFDAVASEPPYHASALEAIVASIPEAARVVRQGRRIAFLVASEQAAAVRSAGDQAGLRLELEAPINRKGTEVSCLCWVR
jgi:tRNA G10  N-methylase Trm11